ncbi:hypothetical protein TRIUR3_30707 [Triticum urartu]|uniref:Uncharacterized protein n=1 Tax=Triticum urartu TaxID=4572 RepID=M7YYA2_TRIUA|nr:hypothetical protein TRIUR3_30707 [Triticum urartu]
MAATEKTGDGELDGVLTMNREAERKEMTMVGLLDAFSGSVEVLMMKSASFLRELHHTYVKG